MKRGDAARAFYARLACANAGLTDPDPRLLEAFAGVRREAFLPPGPWRVFTRAGYVETPSDHVSLLYQDVLVALDASRHVNTGQPSLHARMLHELAPRPGDRIVHVGAGAGYYTALLAALVGPRGSVHAFELDAALARAARVNLRGHARVELVHGSGVDEPFAPADGIYVNAGATHPVPAWFESLRPGGRLCMPLTGADGAGALVRLTRRAQRAWSIALLGPVRFIPCEGARDEPLGERLIGAMDRRELAGTRSLRTGPPDATCTFEADEWWLSTAAATVSRAGS